MRRAATRDDNERGIINVLEAAGAVVQQLEHLDLLVGFRGEWFLIEVKNPDRKTGRSKTKAVGKAACEPGGEWRDLWLLMGPHTHMLLLTQAKWIRENHGIGGKIAIATNGTEALKAIGAIG